MKILAIETSCDDTGITILEAKGGIKKPRPNDRSVSVGQTSFKILADGLAIQNIHAKYGGVFPMMAKREHIKNLPILLAKTLKSAKLEKKDSPVDAVAVTYGPGLEPCLWTGITFAEDLAKKWKVPIIPTNHMEGHIFSVFGKAKGAFKIPKITFPILSLLVSGGHTELILTDKNLKHKILGETLDDAAGEAYDKVARMLGLPYPGGPHISKLAEQEREILGLRRLGSATARARGIFQQKNIRTSQTQDFHVFPRPMIHSKDLNFSFSGLKTSVLYFMQKNPKTKKGEIALEFENAVVETLVSKTKKAIEEYKVKTLIVGGGVSANKHLQRELKRNLGKKIKTLFPERQLARDNAIMIGMAAYLNYLKKGSRQSKSAQIKAQGNLKLG